MSDYKTYVVVGDLRFDDIEDAVDYVERSSIDAATVEIWDADGNFVSSQEVTAEDSYSYVAYAVFAVDEDGLNDWYNDTETFYNSEREAIEAISAKDYGEYDIVAITQTVSEKWRDETVNHVSVKQDGFEVEYSY